MEHSGFECGILHFWGIVQRLKSLDFKTIRNGGHRIETIGRAGSVWVGSAW